MYDINNDYGVPNEEISCPSCGQVYGTNHPLVDANSGECGQCAREMGYNDINLIDASEFIEKYLGYSKL